MTLREVRKGAKDDLEGESIQGEPCKVGEGWHIQGTVERAVFLELYKESGE